MSNDQKFAVLRLSKRRWVVIRLDHTTGHADFPVPEFEIHSRSFDSEIDANAECRRLERQWSGVPA